MELKGNKFFGKTYLLRNICIFFKSFTDDELTKMTREEFNEFWEGMYEIANRIKVSSDEIPRIMDDLDKILYIDNAQANITSGYDLNAFLSEEGLFSTLKLKKNYNDIHERIFDMTKLYEKIFDDAIKEFVHIEDRLRKINNRLATEQNRRLKGNKRE